MSDSIKIVLGVILFLVTCVLCARCHPLEHRVAAAPAAAIAAAVPASLGIDRQDDKIVLRGRVPDDAARQSIVTQANTAYGADRVTDQLTVDAAAEKCAWLGSDAWRAAVEPGDGVTSSLDCRTLVLEGTVADEATRAKVGEDAAARLGPNVMIDNRVKVRDTVAQEQIAAVLKLKNIEFATASAVIAPAGVVTLEEILPVLRDNPATRFEVGGHTDDRGDAAMNQALSEARARAVVEFLAGKGLDANRFTPKGFGPDKPIADNGTPDGRRQNRRIEFVQVGG
jgi:OmpA-OmpF porin, OOP family